jgi:hypothetical protein
VNLNFWVKMGQRALCRGLKAIRTEDNRNTEKGMQVILKEMQRKLPPPQKNAPIQGISAFLNHQSVHYELSSYLMNEYN